MTETDGVGQVKTVDIVRGLFVVRYVSADDQLEPPVVMVGFDPPQDRDGEFILHPDANEPSLAWPGASLVVRASGPVTMRIEVSPRRQAGSMAANVKIERLGRGGPEAAAPGFAAAAADIDFSGLRLIGHVAGIGDVIADRNQWIAGPSAPSRIEGIALDWPNKPPQFGIRYSVRLGRPQAGASPTMEIGAFAGTRGQALPLTGVAFELSGAASSGYRICAEAAFLGLPTMRVAGARVVLSGPTGREPLVGLRIDLEREAAEFASPAAALPDPTPAPAPQSAAVPANPPKAASRVRVFRSRTKEGRSAG